MKLKYIILLLLLPLLLTVSCKPTESSYKAAYDAVKEKQKGEGPTEGTIYNRFRDRVVADEVISESGDTASVRVEAIAFVQDGGMTRGDMKRYNVIVGGFKQVFNAKAMRDRLAGMGYETFVVSTAEPLYYVGAVTTDSVDSAIDVLRKIGKEDELRLRPPYPFILQPAHIRQ